MSNEDAPNISWTREDVEQKFGFRGGAFTRVNTLFSFLAGSLLTVGWYAALMPFHGHFIADMLTERGPTQHATVFLFSWSLVILFIKWRKLCLQRRVLGLSVVPEAADFVLSPRTADQVLDRIVEAVDDPRHFLLLNRIVVALGNLRNLGRVTDVDEILRSQAEQQESMMETSYSLLRGFIWAIPVLGFIGTVLGLSTAIGGFGSVLGSAKDVEQITGALRVVTGGLATAFETTLVSLVGALSLQLLMTFLKKQEEEFLDDCADYCLRKIVNRLRLVPLQQEVS